MTSYPEAQQKKFIKQVATMYPITEELLWRAIPSEFAGMYDKAEMGVD